MGYETKDVFTVAYMYFGDSEMYYTVCFYSSMEDFYGANGGKEQFKYAGEYQYHRIVIKKS